MERLRSIDVVRGLAASGVVLHHCLPQIELGGAGVDFFFVVSGFVIFHAGQGRDASSFLKARAWRIFPLYWIAAGPWIAASIIQGTMTPDRLIGNLLLIPFWLAPATPLLFVAWTLIFECFFYAAAAVTIWLKDWRPVAALWLVALIAWGFGGPNALQTAGNPVILEFLFGVLIALAPRHERLGQLLAIIGCTWLLVTGFFDYSTDVRTFGVAVQRVMLWGIPAAMVVYGLVANEYRLRGRIVILACALGTASYSIYLFHPLLSEAVQVHWLLKFAISISIGGLAWFFFERPIQNLGKRMLTFRVQRKAAEGATPTTAA